MAMQLQIVQSIRLRQCQNLLLRLVDKDTHTLRAERIGCDQLSYPLCLGWVTQQATRGGGIEDETHPLDARLGHCLHILRLAHATYFRDHRSASIKLRNVSPG